MSTDPGRVAAIEAITQERVLAALSTALRLRMRRGGDALLIEVHRATGIPTSSLKDYRDGRAAPSLTYALKLCALFGPTFADELLELAGMVAVPVTCPDAAPDHIGLLRETQATGSAIARGLQPGGGLDHRARADVERAALSLRSQASAWLAAGRAMRDRVTKFRRLWAANDQGRERAA